MNCPICDEELIPEESSGLYHGQLCPINKYRCKSFFCHLAQTKEGERITELYLYQKPIIIYASDHSEYGPHWHVEIDNKAVYHQDDYFSVAQARQQLKRWKALLLFL